MNNGELTDKQERFCEEYLLDLNATQAAIRAGYSKKSAASIGNENLDKPKIKKHIYRLQEARIRRTRIRADRILKELENIGFAREGVKTSDRIKALGMLAKLMGLFEKQISQSPDTIRKNPESTVSHGYIQNIDEPFLNSLTLKNQQKLIIAMDKYFDKKAI